MDFISEFESVLRAAGYEPVKPLRQSKGGVWPRLKYMGEKKPSGRYQLHIDGDIAFGTYGSDKDAFHTWRSWEGQTLKPEDIKANQKWYEAKRKEAEKAEANRHKRMAKWFTRIYKNLPDAPDDHPYLVDKGIDRHSMVKYRPKTKCLVLPVLQMDGKVWSLQYITESGGKFFAGGGKVKGGFMPLNNKGDEWDDIHIAESYSTAMSIRMAMEQPVICAFNAGNLVDVAKAFRKKHKEARMVIAADNDQWPSEKWLKNKKWVNTGIDRGLQAAGHVGGEVKYPEFGEDLHDLKPTDWNDYACYYGLDKLKSKLEPPEGTLFPREGQGEIASSPPESVSPAPQGLTDVEKKWLSLETVVRWHKGTVGFFDKEYSQHNAILFLSYHPDWAGTFIYDDFAKESRLVKALPWDDRRTFKWREITDTDLTQLKAMLWSKHNLKIGTKGEMNETIEVVAQNKVIHPVRDYFDALVWDGDIRLDRWIMDYCNPLSGNEDYITRVAACFIMAAVKRVYHPGTFHKQMLVLEGKQDIGKSTLLKTLATFNGISYFTDKLSFKSIDNPYLCSHLANNLIVEFQELTGFSLQDRNKIKAWISQTEDEMQPKHKMRVEKYPRQFVLAGTTNDASWMNDPTGGVRFWPVHCGKIDLEGITKVVEQLWAEAVYRIKGGEVHYIADDDPVYNLMIAEQSSRYDGHIWLEPVREYVVGHKEITTEDIFKNALFIPTERWTHRAKADVGDCLRALGWDNKSVWCSFEKKAVRKWVKK